MCVCARVYIPRSFFRLPIPACGQAVDAAAPVAWSSSAVHPHQESVKEGLEVPSQRQPMQGQSPAAIPFPTRRQACHRCRPKSGLKGRGAGPVQGLRFSPWRNG